MWIWQRGPKVSKDQLNESIFDRIKLKKESKRHDRSLPRKESLPGVCSNGDWLSALHNTEKHRISLGKRRYNSVCVCTSGCASD